MKFKVILFTFIMLFSSVFTFGDAFFLNVKNDLLSIQSKEHHHIDYESHEKEHHDEKHSEDCEDECHFCFFTGGGTTYFSEITQLTIPFTLEEFSQTTFFYLLLNNDGYLNGIWQPPKYIS
jgi:hypothetical protein